MLHIGRQSITAACPHRINAFSGQFHHRIVRLVYIVHIIAQPAA